MIGFFIRDGTRKKRESNVARKLQPITSQASVEDREQRYVYLSSTCFIGKKLINLLLADVIFNYNI